MAENTRLFYMTFYKNLQLIKINNVAIYSVLLWLRLFQLLYESLWNIINYPNFIDSVNI